MENIKDIQLPEDTHCEDSRSESKECEEVLKRTTADIFFLQNEDSPISTIDKTEEEKLAQSSDNSLSSTVNSPKTTLLGKLKAKQRLQAFFPKLNSILSSPNKKLEEGQSPAKSEKIIKKVKKGHINKAKAVIEEIEEIKKSETTKIISPSLFKERRSSYREKQYRQKSRTKTPDVVRKTYEKGKYPHSWQEIKERQLILEDVQELKRSRHSDSGKCQESSYDFRKQLLFEAPAQALFPLKVRISNGQSKTVPSPYIRYTRKLPEIAYSISHHKYSGENLLPYLLPSEIYNYLPQSHVEIITKLKEGSTKKFTENTNKGSARKWYPKYTPDKPVEECELLEKSLGLSILQNYIDEDEEDEKCTENTKRTERNVCENTQEKSIPKNEIAIKEASLKAVVNKEVKNDTTNVDRTHKKSKNKKQKNSTKVDRKRKRKKNKREKPDKNKKAKTSGDDSKDAKEHTKEKGKRNEARKDVEHKRKRIRDEASINTSEKTNSQAESITKFELNDKRIGTDLDSRKDSKKYDIKNKVEAKVESKKVEKKEPKKSKVQLISNKNNTSFDQYYDNYDLLRQMSPTEERREYIKRESHERLHNTSRRYRKKSSLEDEVKKPNLRSTSTEKKSKENNDDWNKFLDESKKPFMVKQEPIKTEDSLGTPNTDEYHSHWESDEDVSNTISYSPLTEKQINTSWESDEDIKPEISQNDSYARKSRERSTDNTSKKWKGERSLEMPLNIVNLSRRDITKPSTNFSDRKVIHDNQVRLLYEEDSWECSEFLKMRNDIEGEKLLCERKTLSKERKHLELEKRKLAEKLENRTIKYDMFDNFDTKITKDIHFEKDIHKPADYDLLKKSKIQHTPVLDEKRETGELQRIHSNEDKRKDSENDCPPSHSESISEIQSLLTTPKKLNEYDETKITLGESITNDYCKSEVFDSKLAKSSKEDNIPNLNLEKSELKCNINKIKPDEFCLTPNISDSLLSTCDSLTMSDAKNSSKSDILENEYEEFLKAVTTDITSTDDVEIESKITQRSKRETQKTKSRKRRRYSPSSSSSSSDSYESDSSWSTSSSSSSSSSNSSSSSFEKKRRKRKIKAKERKSKDENDLVKIEMTHSIVKDLDDLQAFPVATLPPLQIKQEKEDYPEFLPTGSFAVIENDSTVPLPVPSPVPPPFLNLLPVKQEKFEESISSTADSTTSPTKKVPLIPTKFITPTRRKEAPAPVRFSIKASESKKDICLTKAVSSDVQVKSDIRDSPPFLTSSNSTLIQDANDSDGNDFTVSLAAKLESDELNAYVKELDLMQSIPQTPTLEHKIEDLTVAETNAIDTNTKSMPFAVEEVFSKNERPCNPANYLLTNTAASKDASPIEDKEFVKEHSSSEIENNRRKCIKESQDKRRSLSPKRRSPSSRNKSPSPRNRSPTPKKDSPRRIIARRESSPKRASSPRRKISSKRESPPRRICSPRRTSSPRKTSPPKRKTSPSRLSPRRRRSRDRSPYRPRYRDDLRKISPRRDRSLDRYDRRRRSPSPRSRRNLSCKKRKSISPRHRRSISPRNRLDSPRSRRSSTPKGRRSLSPRTRKSPFCRSPSRRSSPMDSYRRSYSRSLSPEPKKESIQLTLQRLAGIDCHYHQATNKSPINSPVDGFKRSVADSTISDEQLLQQNSSESVPESPYRSGSARLAHSPLSPKRVPLDVRINQVLGLNKEEPSPIPVNYNQTVYQPNYSYNSYTEHYDHYSQYNPNSNYRSSYVHHPPPSPQRQPPVGSSKVVQIGNVLEVVPTEEVTPQEIGRHIPPQKIVQVGNMLQIVPSPSIHIPKEVAAASSDVPVEVLQSINQPPSVPSIDYSISTRTLQEKTSPEELMLQKIAERRAERAKRHEEREQKRTEKEKRRKEKERKKQLKFKLKTENMIKKALRIETEALALGENLEDDENGSDTTPGYWPSIGAASTSPLKPAGKSILIMHESSKSTSAEDGETKKLNKCVKFADGIAPGDGTSPSAGEELSSPPPPKEKRFRKIKKKKALKKKIKVKIIRKSATDLPDDEELDNLPPPSPPPGSPPPHVFPARIKSHTINNIHPTYATGVPLMPVGNYAPQFRPNIPITMPPPVPNLSHVVHHASTAVRPQNQIVSPHGSSLHGPLSHGLSPGLGHGSIPTHQHGSVHRPTGLR